EGFPVAPAVAVYTVAVQRGRVLSLAVSSVAAFSFALMTLAVSNYGRAIGSLLPFAAAWVFGDNLGTRRAYLRELEEKADRLEALVAHVRSAGLAVTVRVEGAPRPLPPALDLSAYRIVQEALTNTLKHAHATRADVALRYADDSLAVEVRDDGRGPVNGDGTG